MITVYPRRWLAVTPNRISTRLPDFLIERSIDWSDPDVRVEIGHALRQKREAESMSLTQAAAAIGISKPHVEALEDVEWDQLPYASAGRAWTERYAGVVKLDLDRFATARVNPERLILSAVAPVLIVVALVALVILLRNVPPDPLVVDPIPPVFADSTVSLRGTGEPRYEIDVFVGDSPVANTSVVADGSWSVEFEHEPGEFRVTVRMSRPGSESPGSSTSFALAIATPTPPSPPTPTPTATLAPSPTLTLAPAPALTATPAPAPTSTSTPAPTPPPDPVKRSGIAEQQNKPYLLDIEVYDPQKELRVEMTTDSVPPDLVYDINIYLVNETQKKEIFETDTEPQDANIGAGVIKLDTEGRVVVARLDPPVPKVYLVVFNRSDVSTEYHLEIFNGRFR